MAIPKILDHERKLKNIQDGVGELSIKEGYDTAADGEASHAEGYNTDASGDYGSHAEGCDTKAIGADAHAEGYNTTASGEDAHAEGSHTVASETSAHAEGNNTVASGQASHAEGSYTTASGHHSHVEGVYTTAASADQHVQGKSNIPDEEDKYAHIVGNGENSSSYSNAHTLDWDGNAWFAGEVYVGSTSGVNRDDGSKKLATEEYVDSNNGIFWATGETTYDELLNAYSQNKLLCYKRNNELFTCSDFELNGNLKGIFTFRNAHTDLDSIGFEYTITYIEDSGWGSATALTSHSSVYSILQRDNTRADGAPISASEAYYRPVYVSTQTPTASDGKVGDIWIQYI